MRAAASSPQPVIKDLNGLPVSPLAALAALHPYPILGGYHGLGGVNVLSSLSALHNLHAQHQLRQSLLNMLAAGR